MSISILDRLPSLAGKKLLAHRLIDQEAGITRSKYITETAGQQAVYLLKLGQAQAFLANPESPPGPYIAMEAAELGMTPLQLANEVVLNGAQWGDELGPSIEAARRGGKKAVSEAVSVEGVVAALEAALARLRAL